MTKQELKRKALDYISAQGTTKDEWYVSDQSAARHILENFFREELDIELCKPEECDNDK